MDCLRLFSYAREAAAELKTGGDRSVVSVVTGANVFEVGGKIRPVWVEYLSPLSTQNVDMYSNCLARVC
jgi:hypothetical protein